MNVFLDTNIYLSFYHYTSNDLEELRKLIVLIEQQEISLWVTKQVIDEFKRNRENKILDAKKKIPNDIKYKYPRFCLDYDEAKSLSEQKNEINETLSLLHKKIEEDINQNSFFADKIIDKLFSVAMRVDSDSFLNKAEIRVKLGNPPGKNGSYGDAINWECLLEKVQDDRELHFISEDKDYFSVLNDEKINSFLEDEWQSKKETKIYAYKRLATFLNKLYPGIKFSYDLEANILIEKLKTSNSYSQSYNLIKQLSEASELSKIQIINLLSSLQENHFIREMLSDSFIKQFFVNTLNKYEVEIDEATKEELKEILNSHNSSDIRSETSGFISKLNQQYFLNYKKWVKKILSKHQVTEEKACHLLASHAGEESWVDLVSKIDMSLKVLYELFESRNNSCPLQDSHAVFLAIVAMIEAGNETDDIIKYILENSYITDKCVVENMFLRGVFFHSKDVIDRNVYCWGWGVGFNMDLSSASFKESELTCATFFDSKFQHAQFSIKSQMDRFSRPNHFQNAIFINCDLTRSCMFRFYAREAVFIKCRLDFVDLSEVNGFQALFLQCNLNGGDFKNSDLRASIFNNSNLENADFSNADLKGASFRNTNLKGVNFFCADLRGADFTNAKNLVLDGAITD